MREEVLAEGEVAIITTNQHCACLNIILRNINIHLTESGFMGFKEQIDTEIECYRCGFFERNYYLLETPYQGVTLYFRPDEMMELQSVLSKAKIMLDIHKLPFTISPSLN